MLWLMDSRASGFERGKKMKNKILLVSVATMLALSVGLIGCGGEEVPEITEYNLTISSTEGGSVTNPGEGTYTYDEGEVVNLVAEPDEGYRFVSWTGDVATTGNVNAASTTIAMNGDYSITANFKIKGVPMEWAVYTSGANVNAIVDDGGYLWVGSYGGLARLNKTTGDMTHYNTANSGLPDNMISSIAKDIDGDLWIGTDNGLAKFDGTNWIGYDRNNSPLPRNDISCLAIDAEGNKWIGVFMGGLIRFDGINWTVYDTPIDDFRSISIDSAGNKWIGGYADGGLAKFDGTNWTVYNQDNSGLPGKWADCITIDADGDLWMGSEGLVRFDGTNWTTYNEANSPLPSNRIRCLAIDTFGNKWIGTYKGFAKFDGTDWTLYSAAELLGFLDEDVYSVAVDADGMTWVGFYCGLAKFDGTDWTVYTTGNSLLPDNYVTSIEIDESDNKWIGTFWGGLVKSDGMNWIIYNTNNSDIPNNGVWIQTIDNEGAVWMNVWNSKCLVKFDGTNWAVYDKGNSGLPEGYVENVAVDPDNNKWMVVHSYEITAWDPVWSSNGTQIAFTSNRNGNADIWIISADGSDPKRITNDPNIDCDPAWSPDSSKIVFSHDRNGDKRTFDIWIIDVDGTDLRQLTFGDGWERNPAWSPDGSKIAYDGIWVMNADGTSLTKIIDGIHPSWSPDGNQIVFSRNGDIWIANADGSDPMQITNDTACDWHPSFSPNGTKITFTSSGSTKPTILNSVEWYPEWPEEGENRDGDCDSSVYSGLTPPLSLDGSPIELQLVTARGDVSIVQQPSQDNSHTAIVEFDDNPLGDADWYEVTISYSDGISTSELDVQTYIDGRSRLLIRGSRVWWHHYDNAAPGRHDEDDDAIWIINTDSTNPTKLIESSESGESQWSPDGGQILYEGNDDNVWLIDTNSNAPTGLTHSFVDYKTLVKFDGTNWAIYDIPAISTSGFPIYYGYDSLAVDADGIVWVGLTTYWDGSQEIGGGLAKFDGTNWVVYNKNNSGLPSNTISGIIVDMSGNVWVGTGGGLVKFDGITWTVYDTTNSNLPSNYTLGLTIGKDENIWMRSDEYLVKSNGIDWTVYDLMYSSGLPNRRINSFSIDEDGSVWIATWGGLGHSASTV
jgi:Tol biopolymer transport system component